MEQELAIKLQEDGLRYHTQVEIPVTTADFYFPLESRPLLRVRRWSGPSRGTTDGEGRRITITLTEKRIQVLEIFHDDYSDKKRDQLHEQVLAELR